MVIFYSYVKYYQRVTVWKTLGDLESHLEIWEKSWENIYGKLKSHWKIRGMFRVFFCCWSTDLWSNVVENVFRTHRNMHCWNPKPKATAWNFRAQWMEQHLDLRPASPASGFHQQNMAQQSTKKPGWNRSDSEPLPGFSAQKPLEPPAASNITGVTQVSTMIRMAKKQSKLNLGRNRLLHVALSHPRYKNGTWGRKVNLAIYALVALMYLQ